ncbi:MAG: type I methionyl aminopeptidase [Desulfuromonadales bacterium]|nr:type I methionyl aminopeptidase [Desulfuromonadales bacterium]MDT8422701.1 type I methionyl aminopeptidase [Desulfuromonadales bacterium]
MITLKSRAEIKKMRSAGKIVAEILALLKERVAPGITSLELDGLAEAECKKYRARPAFKGYGGFPYCICASPNEKVVHGFPNSSPLDDGDFISIDFGVIYNGYYGDAALTIPVGTMSAEKQHLMDVTESSLRAAIEKAVVGNRISDISHAVQSTVEYEGYSVVREFVGHGIGKRLHEAPQIPNFGLPGQGPRLKAGMTLAIEPMINAGGPEIRILSDGWTAVTQDSRPSAHFEHTVAVTEDGPEILTVL